MAIPAPAFSQILPPFLTVPRHAALGNALFYAPWVTTAGPPTGLGGLAPACCVRRSVAATESPQGPPRGTRTRHPASGLAAVLDGARFMIDSSMRSRPPDVRAAERRVTSGHRMVATTSSAASASSRCLLSEHNPHARGMSRSKGHEMVTSWLLRGYLLT